MSNNNESLEAKLRSVQKQYRRQHLADELDELAETMEETLLQRELASAFFDENVEVDTSARQSVREVMNMLEEGEYEAIEERLAKLESEVESAETTVQNRIQELRLKHNSTVTAMQRLNDRVDRVDELRLRALGGLLDDWRWKEHVYPEDDVEFETLAQNAREYGREMRDAFDELQEALFGHYPPDIRSLIERMIDDERLSYADLEPEQRTLLAESDIGEYIELTLS
jgi:ribosomal protein S20